MMLLSPQLLQKATEQLVSILLIATAELIVLFADLSRGKWINISIDQV